MQNFTPLFINPLVSTFLHPVHIPLDESMTLWHIYRSFYSSAILNVTESTHTSSRLVIMYWPLWYTTSSWTWSGLFATDHQPLSLAIQRVFNPNQWLSINNFFFFFFLVICGDFKGNCSSWLLILGHFFLQTRIDISVLKRMGCINTFILNQLIQHIVYKRILVFQVTRSLLSVLLFFQNRTKIKHSL